MKAGKTGEAQIQIGLGDAVGNRYSDLCNDTYKRENFEAWYWVCGDGLFLLGSIGITVGPSLLESGAKKLSGWIRGVLSRGSTSADELLAVEAKAAIEFADEVVSSSRWSRTSFDGNRIFQRSDLIDPTRLDRTGLSNLERMERGLAPIGPDGKAINLHHMIQTEAGPIAEVSATMHQQ